MSLRLGSIFVATLSACLVVLAIACSDDKDPDSIFDDSGTTDTGSSGSSGSSGSFPDGGADADMEDTGLPPGTLQAIIRDFRLWDAAAPDGSRNPDFENVPPDSDRPADSGTAAYFGNWTEATPAYYPGADYPIDIVLPDLGADNVPQYNAGAVFKGTTGRTATTHGKTFFDQWYHDTTGANVVRKVNIELTKKGSVYSYDSAVSGIPLSPTDPGKGFFPIDDGTPFATDDAGFGNEGLPHNYSFTVELHTKFNYKGNESFTFSGDDDVFVFINRKLVINIGGIHGALTKGVNLPEVAAAIGLVVGQNYPLDFFQAERHVVQSNLRIDTTLELTGTVVK